MFRTSMSRFNPQKTSYLRPITRHEVTGVREEDGMRWVRSFRILHPARQQRVFLIGVPRFALKTFYNDWIYQPYLKENVQLTSTDLEAPPFYQNFARLLVFNRNKEEYQDYDSFYSRDFPDAVDANVTRRDAFNREHVIRSIIWRQVLMTTAFRDYLPICHAKYLRKHLLRVMGPAHSYHPGVESGQSFVVLVPVGQVNTALDILENELGFEIAEAIEHDIGEEAKLSKLDRVGLMGNRLIILYIWYLLTMVGMILWQKNLENMKAHEEEYLETKARMIRNAG